MTFRQQDSSIWRASPAGLTVFMQPAAGDSRLTQRLIPGGLSLRPEVALVGQYAQLQAHFVRPEPMDPVWV